MHQVPDLHSSSWHCKLAGPFAYMHASYFNKCFQRWRPGLPVKKGKELESSIWFILMICPPQGSENMRCFLLKGLCKLFHAEQDCEVALVSILPSPVLTNVSVQCNLQLCSEHNSQKSLYLLTKLLPFFLFS